MSGEVVTSTTGGVVSHRPMTTGSWSDDLNSSGLNSAGWLKSLDRYQDLDVDIVIPGHGEVTDKFAIKKMKDTVKSWLDVVGDTVKQGLSLEEAMEQVLQTDMLVALSKERPADFMIRMNIEKLYQHLKK